MQIHTCAILRKKKEILPFFKDMRRIFPAGMKAQ
jgi:hypothetical protein